MILVRAMLASLAALGATAAANAADHCLTRNEQKAKAAAHAVVPLSRAMRAVRARGEIIHARLCEHGGRLVYVLTVFGEDGKVAQAGVDAANGGIVVLHETEKTQKADKAEKAEKPERSEKAEKAEKADKAEKTEKTEKTEQ